MKSAPWLVLVLVVFGCAGKTGKPRESASFGEKATAGTILEISEKIHNFGRLVAGEITVHTFVFRNGGTGELVVLKTENGCSCLTVEPGVKTIKPGETGTVKVIFNTSGLYGNQFQSFRLLFENEGVTMDFAVMADVLNENLELKQ